MNEAEKRLLKAIFETEVQKGMGEMPDNFPDTNEDKIGYAAYAATKSLEYLSPALQRLYHCEAFCKLDTPNIITNNEMRMALEYLSRVKCNIDDAYNELLTVYKRTKDSNQSGGDVQENGG